MTLKELMHYCRVGIRKDVDIPINYRIKGRSTTSKKKFKETLLELVRKKKVEKYIKGNEIYYGCISCVEGNYLKRLRRSGYKGSIPILW